MSNAYTLLKTDGLARRGILHTQKGTAQTPLFMPIATVGAIKGGVEPDDLRAMGVEIILSNTYHLHLRPGEALVREKGGLAKFMGWHAPILTDSGGFQAFSLAKINQIKEEGITFRSHIDGSYVLLTPESVMEIQHTLGIDIAMQFDECTPYPCSDVYARESLERSLRWAERCKTRWLTLDPERKMHLFGIVQGTFSKPLREHSAKSLVDMDLPGYAIGGVVVDFSRTHEALEYALPHLPTDKPRYLMGVGTPLDIINAVAQGIDMFDCVLPTRNGRHGKVFTFDGEYRIVSSRWASDSLPIDTSCPCRVCANYSRAYVRHLFSVDEQLGPRLATIHNLHFYLELMRQIRNAIEQNSFAAYRTAFIARYQAGMAERAVS